MSAPAQPRPRIVVTGALVHRTPARPVREDLVTDGGSVVANTPPPAGRDVADRPTPSERATVPDRLSPSDRATVADRPAPSDRAKVPDRPAPSDRAAFSDPTAVPGQAAPTGIRIDGRGASVVPLLVDTVFATSAPPAPDAFDLSPGHPATFAVIGGTVSPDRITRMLVVNPASLRAVVVHGNLVVRDGAATRSRGGHAPDDPRLGAWRDPRRDMTQYLTPDGRYTETRGTTRDAYTGSFWLDGDRITYLDDTGFWAFGQYHDGVLHHAGFVLRRV